ncbi:MAG: hypothetical protein JW931_04285 [Methanomicrobiaceae archaeon]|nr:hypothetical protein [Methanomicrobiaceae archaeon]
MKDPRTRMASMILLSCASFAGPKAAIASMAWIIVFSERRLKIPSPWAFLGLFIMVSIISIISLGIGGISYFIRMTSLILIAVWAYSEIRPGEILDTLVWFPGGKTGFELGLIAETAMSEIRRIPRDFRMTRTAISFKGKKLSLKEYIPVLGNILIITLRRADEQGKMLAVRGYIHGGTHASKFDTDKKDIIGLFFAFATILFALANLVTYL